MTGAETAPNRRRPFRLLTYGGLLLAFAGVVSYFTVFYRYPALRDVPWVNLPLVLLGLGLCFVGLRRAWRAGGGRLSRFLSAFAFGLATFFAATFIYYVFWMSYQLPAESRALAVGDPAPAFALPDADGGSVALADLRGRRILLVFYRGHW